MSFPGLTWPRVWGLRPALCLCSSRKPGPALPSSCCRSRKFLWAMGGKLADEGLGLFRGIQKHSGHLCPLSARNVFRNKTRRPHPAALETAAGRPHCARECDHRSGGAGAGWVPRAEAGPHQLGSQHGLTRLEPRGGPRSPPMGCRRGWALLTPTPSLWTGDRPSRSQDASGLEGSSGDCGFQLARAEKGGRGCVTARPRSPGLDRHGASSPWAHRGPQPLGSETASEDPPYPSARGCGTAGPSLHMGSPLPSAL